jgi:hypothetical protein
LISTKKTGIILYLYGMQLVITEKQLEMLSSQFTEAHEVKEQDDPAAAAPDTGTSSDGEKKTGATKWESGVTRGPANQIGVTKWSDTVGSSLKRGKANPLSEQMFVPAVIPSIMAADAAKNDTPYVELTTPWRTKIKIPADAQYKLWEPEADRRKSISKDRIREFGNRVYWKIGYDKKIEDDVYELVKNAQLSEVLPDGTLRYFTTSDGKDWIFVITRTGIDPLDKSGIWTSKYKTFVHHPSPTAAYENYDPKKYITKSVSTMIIEFFDDYGELILQVVLSVAIGIITMGQSLWIQALAEFAINAAFAAKQLLVDKDNFGAGLSLIIGVLPFASVGLRYGLGKSFAALSKYGPELSQAKTLDEAKAIISGFTEAEQVLIKKALSLPEATLVKGMNEGSVKIFLEGIKKKTIDIAKIPFQQRTWVWQSTFELLSGGAIVWQGIKYKKEMMEKESEEFANIATSFWSPQNGFDNPEFKKAAEEMAKQYGEEYKQEENLPNK